MVAGLITQAIPVCLFFSRPPSPFFVQCTTVRVLVSGIMYQVRVSHSVLAVQEHNTKCARVRSRETVVHQVLPVILQSIGLIPLKLRARFGDKLFGICVG